MTTTYTLKTFLEAVRGGLEPYGQDRVKDAWTVLQTCRAWRNETPESHNPNDGMPPWRLVTSRDRDGEAVHGDPEIAVIVERIKGMMQSPYTATIRQTPIVVGLADATLEITRDEEDALVDVDTLGLGGPTSWQPVVVGGPGVAIDPPGSIVEILAEEGTSETERTDAFHAVLRALRNLPFAGTRTTARISIKLHDGDPTIIMEMERTERGPLAAGDEEGLERAERVVEALLAGFMPRFPRRCTPDAMARIEEVMIAVETTPASATLRAAASRRREVDVATVRSRLGRDGVDPDVIALLGREGPAPT